jgi:glycosyltransferase involved in cell wall biosynthesis
MKRGLVRIAKRLAGRPAIPKASTTGPLIGYAAHLTGSPKGRALLSYLPEPLRQELAGQPENEFSNRGVIRSLGRALNELDYLVDIVSWDDTSYQTNDRYDLLIQHGGVNYETLRPFLKPSGTLIYFSTGSYWRYHNAAEKRRFAAFDRRHGFQPSYDRLITFSEEKVDHDANGIIALGNDVVKETYKKFPRVYNLNLASYPDPHAGNIAKSHTDTKNNFLFIAGGGAIHKGVDLAIEAFRGLRQHLYIMAYVEPEVQKVYAKDLERANIHFIGPTEMRSAAFYEAMSKCSFAVLPSCSEGQPGSIVEALNNGLIPVVTRDVHLSVNNYGFLLKTASITEIRKTVQAAANLDSQDIVRRARKAHQVTLKQHSPELFVSTLKSYMQKIVKETSK